MDNTQAAAVLRQLADEATVGSKPAFTMGADALEMLEWLFTQEGEWPMSRALWAQHGGNVKDFLAYCEARFEEHRKHG